MSPRGGSGGGGGAGERGSSADGGPPEMTEGARVQRIHSKACTRWVLARYCGGGVAPTDLTFARGAHGKPFLAGVVGGGSGRTVTGDDGIGGGPGATGAATKQRPFAALHEVGVDAEVGAVHVELGRPREIERRTVSNS